MATTTPSLAKRVENLEALSVFLGGDLRRLQAALRTKAGLYYPPRVSLASHTSGPAKVISMLAWREARWERERA